MNGARIATAILAVLTLGLAIGGTMAFVVMPVPAPTVVTPVQVLTYTIRAGIPTEFRPYLTSTQSAGLVEFQFINQDRAPHAYLLEGTGWTFVAPPVGTTTAISSMPHAGVYYWVSLIPSPGVRPDQTVGILVVG
jgi:hypothetical protein